MGHTTRYGNYYSDNEWEDTQDMFQEEQDEGTAWLEAYENALQSAAQYLHQEFSQVPATTWLSALRNPDSARFTSEHKKARFQAAQGWIKDQMK
jgi:hypothetical protein